MSVHRTESELEDILSTYLWDNFKVDSAEIYKKDFGWLLYHVADLYHTESFLDAMDSQPYFQMLTEEDGLAYKTDDEQYYFLIAEADIPNLLPRVRKIDKFLNNENTKQNRID